VLEAAGVQQLVELPGVGENYQGKIYLLSTTYHNLFIRNPRPQCGLVPYLADGEAETLDAISEARRKKLIVSCRHLFNTMDDAGAD